MIHEVSAGGVPISEGKVYILKKKNGEWVMPKGHLEQGETPETAALREVLEEAGIVASLLDKVGETHYRFTVPPSKEVREKTVHWFLMEVIERTNTLEPVFEKVVLVEIPAALKLLTFEADRRILRQAAELQDRLSD